MADKVYLVEEIRHFRDFLHIAPNCIFRTVGVELLSISENRGHVVTFRSNVDAEVSTQDVPLG